MSAQGQKALEERLIGIAQASSWLMQVLHAVRGLGLSSWCVGAGAVRNLVWDALHEHSAPSALPDVDVAWFDQSASSLWADEVLQKQLTRILPGVPWEVTNQAKVHEWFEDYFGYPVQPLLSLEEAVATWPEYATSVGLTLKADDTIQVIAPHGLEDLFGLIVRRNPTRVSVENYRDRVEKKRYAERWPRVKIVSC